MKDLTVNEVELTKKFNKVVDIFLNTKMSSEYSSKPCMLIEKGKFNPVSRDELKMVLSDNDELKTLKYKVKLSFKGDDAISIVEINPLNEQEKLYLENVMTSILRCGYTIQYDGNHTFSEKDFTYIINPSLLKIITFPDEKQGILLYGYIMRHQYCMFLTDNYFDLYSILEDLFEPGESLERTKATDNIYTLRSLKGDTFTVLSNILKKIGMRPNVIKFEFGTIIFTLTPFFNKHEIKINKLRYGG